ncbi:hypothetical protein BIWAKO_05344 [Bosea sp. BIWAKO-01]|nr:hypothetical protein BIWAKO_05344 [Bosea sp. BIWAKO-01]
MHRPSVSTSLMERREACRLRLDLMQARSRATNARDFMIAAAGVLWNGL